MGEAAAAPTRSDARRAFAIRLPTGGPRSCPAEPECGAANDTEHHQDDQELALTV